MLWNFNKNNLTQFHTPINESLTFFLLYHQITFIYFSNLRMFLNNQCKTSTVTIVFLFGLVFSWVSVIVSSEDCQTDLQFSFTWCDMSDVSWSMKWIWLGVNHFGWSIAMLSLLPITLLQAHAHLAWNFWLCSVGSPCAVLLGKCNIYNFFVA